VIAPLFSGAMLVDQLLPPGDPIDIEEHLARVCAPHTAALRPHVIGSLISSVNGRSTLDGRTWPMGSQVDRAIFRGLRGICDAIMVGTGTLRAEKYGRPGRKRTLRESRAERGLAEEPKVLVVSRSLDLPTRIPLFRDPDTEILLYTWSDAPVPSVGAQMQVTRLDPADQSLAAVLRSARAEHGVRSVVCEGGPRIFGALLDEDLVDELFLTIAPVYAGDAEMPLTSGGHRAQATPMSLVNVLSHEANLFLRYQRAVVRAGTEAVSTGPDAAAR
jgi:riboflavin biosynthesis pyrimidine reductase